jgi:4-diphosphocytidyl-2-C-methyl-D-erythritol kinase
LRLPPLRRLHFVVIKPPLGLFTADVYRAHDSLSGDAKATRYSLGELTAAIAQGRWDDLRRWMHNRLQAAAASLLPWVDEVSAIADRLGFVAHQLSGSGSAYFGVCRHVQQARRLAAILRTRQLGLVVATSSCQ